MYSTSLQCSLSACFPLNMSVSHCCRSIYFPRGLSGFLVYAWVAISVAPAHISFPSSGLISPLSGAKNPSPFFCSSSPTSRSPVSPHFSSKPCPVTVLFVPTNISLSSASSLTKNSTLLHPLQVKVKLCHIQSCRTESSYCTMHIPHVCWLPPSGVRYEAPFLC